jgi:hypothetical protein
MRSLIILLITLPLFLFSSSAALGQCDIYDPLIDSNYPIDLCCNFQQTSDVCYDVSEAVDAWTGQTGPFYLLEFNFPPNGIFYDGQFTTFAQLATLLTDNNTVGASFTYNASNKTICAYDVNPSFELDDYMKICNSATCGQLRTGKDNSEAASTDIFTIYPDITEVECPIEEPDMAGVLDSTVTADGTVVVFDGSAGTLTTGDLSNTQMNDPDYTGGFVA